MATQDAAREAKKVQRRQVSQVKVKAIHSLSRVWSWHPSKRLRCSHLLYSKGSVLPVEFEANEAEPGDELPSGLKINAPIRPKRKELREHSHFPSRLWCEACVRGKAKANPHKRVDHSDETTPVVTVDDCFVNSRTDDVVMDEKTQAPIVIFQIFDGRSASSPTCYPTKV